MAQLKAHQVERYVAKPDSAHRVILVYGPDRGLVSEHARSIAKASKADLDDPFSTIRIDADDAASDPSRLADEAHTVSMFGGERLIWVNGSTQKQLIKAIDPLLATPPQDAIVLIEAGDLKKTAPVRTRIEKSPHAMALPCFADKAEALDKVISSELASHGLSIDNDARRLLVSLLGGDRQASRNEVAKLCLYATGKGSIEVEDIEAIVGDASSLAVDTVIDAASVGDIKTMEHTFKRLIAQGTGEVTIILAFQRHFQMLHEARCRMESSGAQAQSAVDAMRPPVNFQRKRAVTQALSRWPPKALTRMLHRLDKVSLDVRAHNTLATSLASTALLAIALEARRYVR